MMQQPFAPPNFPRSCINPLRAPKPNLTYAGVIESCNIQTDAEAVATSTFRGSPTQSSLIYSCVSNDNNNCGYEVHVIGNYESNGHSGFRVHNTGYTDLYMAVTGNSSRLLILVLSSYEPVDWTLHIPDGVVIDTVILV